MIKVRPKAVLDQEYDCVCVYTHARARERERERERELLIFKHTHCHAHRNDLHGAFVRGSLRLVSFCPGELLSYNPSSQRRLSPLHRSVGGVTPSSQGWLCGGLTGFKKNSVSGCFVRLACLS